MQQSTPSLRDSLVDKSAAARRLGVCLRTLDYWIQNRRIPYIKTGRLVRFIPADIDKFILDHRIK